MVGEVGFAQNEETGQRAHQVVVDPEAAHRVVHGRVDAHRDLVGVLVGDALVHLEEVAVHLAQRGNAEACSGVGEIEVDASASRTHAATLVAHALGSARRDVARGEVAVAGIETLQVVVALGGWDLCR
jgi:hypothetical protein